jgi:hypothetical protein
VPRVQRARQPDELRDRHHRRSRWTKRTICCSRPATSSSAGGLVGEPLEATGFEDPNGSDVPGGRHRRDLREPAVRCDPEGHRDRGARIPETGRGLADAVAELGRAVGDVDQIDPAHHPTGPVTDHEHQAGAGLVLGEQGPVAVREAVEERITPVVDAAGEERAVVALKGEQLGLVIRRQQADADRAVDLVDSTAPSS